MKTSLTSPFNLGSRTCKNRMIAAAPPSLTAANDGSVTDATLAFYQKLAETGVAIVITEPISVTANARAWAKQLDASHGSSLSGYSQIAEKIRRGGALPVIQLYHGGCNQLSIKGAPIYGVSKTKLKKIAAEILPLTHSMLEQIVRDYVDAALTAWNAGFSGIEINAAEGSLLQQFFSPLTNARNDEYGRSNGNGAFFARQLVRAIKNVTPDLALSLKISLKDLLPGGMGLSQAINIARRLAQDGVDIFQVTEGLSIGNPLLLHPALGGSAPDVPFAEDAHIFKNETGLQVILSGKIGCPATAERQLSLNRCDLVSLGRTLCRSPHFPAFAGNLEEYQTLSCLRCKVCVAASQGCPDKQIPFARII